MIIMKLRGRARAGVLSLTLALAACGGAATVSSVATSPVGQSLINALTNTLVPGVNAAMAKGVGAAKPELDVAAYVLPWADDALQKLGPDVGLGAAQIAKYHADVQTAEALVANPPADIGSAVADALQVYQRIVGALKPALST